VSGAATDTLRVASYNVHGCVGAGGSYDPERIARVIEELEADVVGLKEVDARRPYVDGMHQFEYLAAKTGMTAVAGPTIEHPEEGHYGNLLLTRLPVRAERQDDLSLDGREPRGIVLAELDWNGRALTVACTHRGLKPWERRSQVSALLSLLPEPDAPLVLMGDFNEWIPRSRVLQPLYARFRRARSPATFPARRPFLALDRIWTNGVTESRTPERWRSPRARVASDHLPLVAEIRA